MRRLFSVGPLLLLLASLAVPCVQAQTCPTNFAQVTATQIGIPPLATGMLIVKATDASHNPINYSVAGSGVELTKSHIVPIVNGAITQTLCLPRSDLSSVPVGYHFTAIDTSSAGGNAPVLDVQDVAVTTNPWSLDSYSFTPQSNPYTLLQQHGFNNRGTWTASSTYAAYDTFQQNGSTYLVTTPYVAGSSFGSTDIADTVLFAAAGAQGPAGPAGSGNGYIGSNLLLNTPNTYAYISIGDSIETDIHGGWPRKLAALLGATGSNFVNNGTGGAGFPDLTTGGLATFPLGIGANTKTTMGFGYNDWNSMFATGPTPEQFQYYQGQLIAWMYEYATPDALKVTAASGTQTGTWTSYTANAAPAGSLQTTTAGNTITWSGYGTEAGVLMYRKPGDASTFSVTVDGVAIADPATGSSVLTQAASYPSTLTPGAAGLMAFRIANLQGGQHTVVYTSGTCASTCNVVGPMFIGGQHLANSPAVAKLLTVYNGGNSGAESDANLNLMRNLEVATVSELKSNGLNVTWFSRESQPNGIKPNTAVDMGQIFTVVVTSPGSGYANGNIVFSGSNCSIQPTLTSPLPLSGGSFVTGSYTLTTSGACTSGGSTITAIGGGTGATFTGTYSNDGLHPNEIGGAKTANLALRALNAAKNTADTYTPPPQQTIPIYTGTRNVTGNTNLVIAQFTTATPAQASTGSNTDGGAVNCLIDYTDTNGTARLASTAIQASIFFGGQGVITQSNTYNYGGSANPTFGAAYLTNLGSNVVQMVIPITNTTSSSVVNASCHTAGTPYSIQMLPNIPASGTTYATASVGSTIQVGGSLAVTGNGTVVVAKIASAQTLGVSCWVYYPDPGGTSRIGETYIAATGFAGRVASISQPVNFAYTVGSPIFGQASVTSDGTYMYLNVPIQNYVAAGGEVVNASCISDAQASMSVLPGGAAGSTPVSTSNYTGVDLNNNLVGRNVPISNSLPVSANGNIIVAKFTAIHDFGASCWVYYPDASGTSRIGETFLQVASFAQAGTGSLSQPVNYNYSSTSPIFGTPYLSSDGTYMYLNIPVQNYVSASGETVNASCTSDSFSPMAVLPGGTPGGTPFSVPYTGVDTQGNFTPGKLAAGTTVPDPTVATSQQVASANWVTNTVAAQFALGRVSATTSSIGGSALAAGTCATGTAAYPGGTGVPGHTVGVSPSDGIDIGDLFYFKATITDPATITVKVCAVSAATPTAKTYNVTTY